MTKRIVPLAWMPNVFPKQNPRYIVLHWTGGGPNCTDLDRQHYHIIVDQQCFLHRGYHSIKDNCRPMLGSYAAHALNFNGGAIGVSLCGMAGAVEHPFKPGAYPITKAQWETAAQVCAELCLRYNINAFSYNVCQHGEIEERHGVKQRQKWDCCKLPWALDLRRDEACREFRLEVQKRLALLKGNL